jgi:integrase
MAAFRAASSRAGSTHMLPINAGKSIKFTQTNVKTCKATPGKSDETIWDDAMPGFGIRFRNGGPGTFVIQYSLNGKQAKIGLGKVSKVTLEAAQTDAKQHFAMIARKVDPLLERAKQEAKAGDNFAEGIEAFLAALAKDRSDDKPARTPNYIGATRRSLERYFKSLHRYGVGEITRKMVTDQLDTIAENHGERAAGTSRAHLSSYYSFLMEKGYDGFNPVDGTASRNSRKRNRWLSREELALIWRATEGDDDYNIIVRLLMLTAARKTIFGSLKRSEYIPKTRIIDVPIETGKSKNKTRFWLALSPRAEAILRGVVDRREGSNFVFGDGGEGGFSGWSKAKDALDAKITELNGGKPLDHWVLHDFRRTFVTLGVEKAGIEDSTADICLHHVGEAKKGIKGAYNHAHHIEKKHAAMKAWADFVDEATRGKPDLRAVETETA